MTQSLSVAYSELTRVLPWSLRALGYRFGIADRASHLVATAASMTPDVLEDIAKASRRPIDALAYSRNNGLLSIDARGVSWLEVGPVVMDYLGAHAESNDDMFCRVSGATEPRLIPAVLLTGAEYGLSTLAIRCTSEGIRWEIFDVGDAGEQPVLVSGQGMEGLGTTLGATCGLLDVLPTGVTESPGVTLLSRGGHLGFRPKMTAQQVILPGDKVARAFERGIAVAPGVLKSLYDLEKITWAPTSERSRAQAGFQRPPIG